MRWFSRFLKDKDVWYYWKYILFFLLFIFVSVLLISYDQKLERQKISQEIAVLVTPVSLDGLVVASSSSNQYKMPIIPGNPLNIQDSIIVNDSSRIVLFITSYGGSPATIIINKKGKYALDSLVKQYMETQLLK